jgi:DNA repair protein RecO (recombination protein O)
MNQINTKGIVLARTDFGEADRILTLLTPDNGKLRLMAKGVRRIKSKLAGGIELFSVSDITFMKGRGDMGTLISARLNKHFGTIVKDIERTMLGYELIKQLNKATEDEPEPEYFELLQQAFAALDDPALNLDLIRVWFEAQLLRLSGHTPNLQTEASGEKLTPDAQYEFSFDDTAFARQPRGNFHADDIKFLRLLFGGNQPAILAKIVGNANRIETVKPLVRFMQQQYIH